MTHSLVVGGTKGLGRVVTRLFAERGDTVSVLGRSEVPPDDLKSGDVRSYRADINDKDSLGKALDEIVAAGGPVNYCVFLQRYRGKDDDWAGELQTTLTATKNIVDQLSTKFSSDADNGVVMVSSVFAKYVGEGQALSYHVAKAGLDQMMRWYALNLAGRQIRVNGVTPFTFLKEESKSFYLGNKPLVDLYESIVPLKRMATTEDSASVVLFLCSTSAGFVTGQNITVDGGLSLAWPESIARRLKQI
jgi:NAD(P)-dependent dehydrogenase (short-subunit alcohol dehydrogenase family)